MYLLLSSNNQWSTLTQTDTATLNHSDTNDLTDFNEQFSEHLLNS